MTYFAEIGKFQKERWMSPRQLKEYNKNKKEYEKKYKEKEKQFDKIRSEIMKPR